MATNGLLTSKGNEILVSSFRSYVRYAYLICNDGPTYNLQIDPSLTLTQLKDAGWYLWKKSINAAFFDEDGILTYVIQLEYNELPPDPKYNWIYGLAYIYQDPSTYEEIIVGLSTVPVVEKVLGQTLQFITKFPVSDTPAQIIFGSVVFHSGLDPNSVYTKTQVDELFATKEELKKLSWFSWILG